MLVCSADAKCCSQRWCADVCSAAQAAVASDTQLSCSRAHSHTQRRCCPSYCLHRNSFSLSLANSVLQTFPELMRVFLAVTLASQAAGNALNWGPDRAKVRPLAALACITIRCRSWPLSARY